MKDHKRPEPSSEMNSLTNNKKFKWANVDKGYKAFTKVGKCLVDKQLVDKYFDLVDKGLYLFDRDIVIVDIVIVIKCQKYCTNHE